MLSQLMYIILSASVPSWPKILQGQITTSNWDHQKSNMPFICMAYLTAQCNDNDYHFNLYKVMNTTRAVIGPCLKSVRVNTRYRMLRAWCLVVSYHLLGYRHTNDVTEKLLSLLCTTWRGVFRSVINHIWTAEMKWKWRSDRRNERNWT